MAAPVIAIVYWTEVDVTPVCDAHEHTWIAKTQFHCDYATKQMYGIGSFTNTMVQFRDGGKDGDCRGPYRWQYLAPGYNDCPGGMPGRLGQAWRRPSDSPLGRQRHQPAGPVDRRSEASELSWGSAPRNLGYTVLRRQLPELEEPARQNVQLSRPDIMKEVTKKVLSSVNNLNVGLMRFNRRQGGPVILGITDLDSQPPDVIDAIDTLPAGGCDTAVRNAL